MTQTHFGTIAALDFCVVPRQGFEDIVEELDITFRPYGVSHRSLTWDGDDIAMIERDGLRLLLGWVPTERADGSHFLVIGVGPSPHSTAADVGPESCQFVKTVLMEHLESYLTFREVLHVDASRPLNAEFMDAVGEMLHGAPAPKPAPPRFDLASEVPLTDLDVVEADGNAPDEATPCSLPQRLTIYTLGATMLLYTPPIGASLLVYSTLRDFAPAKLPKLTSLAA